MIGYPNSKRVNWGRWKDNYHDYSKKTKFVKKLFQTIIDDWRIDGLLN